MVVTPGEYAPTGPNCKIKQLHGEKVGRCMDGDSGRIQPGGSLAVWPCRKIWHQIFSFGSGALKETIHMNIPIHLQTRINIKHSEQELHMCVGVLGRGDGDEKEWEEDKKKRLEREAVQDNSATPEEEEDYRGFPLSEWEGEQLVTTRCSNTGGIIEWALIPFVHITKAEYVLPNGTVIKNEDDVNNITLGDGSDPNEDDEEL